MMTVQPINSFVDSNGEAFLRLSNGHKIKLPDSTGGTPGVTDHGALTGLTDVNDHPQYVKDVGDTMTGTLIQATDTSSGATQGIEVRSPGYPAVLLNKTNAPANEHLWKLYLSGAAGTSGTALSFLPMQDNPLTPAPTIRMYRDGRMLLGANPTATMDAATKAYVDGASVVGGIVWNGWGSFSGMPLKAHKAGSVVHVAGALYSSGLVMAAGVQYKMIQMPVGARPVGGAVSFPAFFWADAASANNHASWGYIDTAGWVWIESQKAMSIFSHDFFSFNFTYPVV